MDNPYSHERLSLTRGPNLSLLLCLPSEDGDDDVDDEHEEEDEEEEEDDDNDNERNPARPPSRLFSHFSSLCLSSALKGEAASRGTKSKDAGFQSLVKAC